MRYKLAVNRFRQEVKKKFPTNWKNEIMNHASYF